MRWIFRSCLLQSWIGALLEILALRPPTHPKPVPPVARTWRFIQMQIAESAYFHRVSARFNALNFSLWTILSRELCLSEFFLDAKSNLIFEAQYISLKLIEVLRSKEEVLRERIWWGWIVLLQIVAHVCPKNQLAIWVCPSRPVSIRTGL